MKEKGKEMFCWKMWIDGCSVLLISLRFLKIYLMGPLLMILPIHMALYILAKYPSYGRDYKNMTNQKKGKREAMGFGQIIMQHGDWLLMHKSESPP